MNMSEKIDYRKNQKVIATLVLEDRGQDFTEIDVLENGVILGYSPIFEKGQLTMIGLGTLDGKEYWTFEEMKEDLADRPLIAFFIYFKDTEKITPLPWNASTIKYKIVDVIKANKPNRFIKKCSKTLSKSRKKKTT